VPLDQQETKRPHSPVKCTLDGRTAQPYDGSTFFVTGCVKEAGRRSESRR
jgi:hypothetical protein